MYINLNEMRDFHFDLIGHVTKLSLESVLDRIFTTMGTHNFYYDV